MVENAVFRHWNMEISCSPLFYIILNLQSLLLTLPVSTQVTSLGIILDSTLSFSSHINIVFRIAFLHPRNISRLRPALTQHSSEVQVNALVTSRIDYCNAILAGIPNKLIHRLQLIQYSAAQIITRSKSTEHVTPLLTQLHWLPVSQRITFKILLSTYKALHDLSPPYLTDLLPTYTPPLAPCDLHQQVDWHHRSSDSAQWVPGLSPMLHPNSGTHLFKLIYSL